MSGRYRQGVDKIAAILTERGFQKVLVQKIPDFVWKSAATKPGILASFQSSSCPFKIAGTLPTGDNFVKLALLGAEKVEVVVNHICP